MVTIKKDANGYLSVYHNHIFIAYLGKEANFTPEKLNYLKRKYNNQIKHLKEGGKK